MTTVYLSSPKNQMQADYLRDMPVLMSFAVCRPWMDDYMKSWGPMMLDSGAFSELSSGAKVDLDKYAEYAWDRRTRMDSAAALDDIGGDWERGLANWDAYPWTFPVVHDTDPAKYVDAVLERLQDDERARLHSHGPQWLGIGLMPPRRNRDFVLSVLLRASPNLHVHLFAMRGFMREALKVRGWNISTDSTSWFRNAMSIKAKLTWLTYAECVEIVAKRYKRQAIEPAPSVQGALFD